MNCLTLAKNNIVFNLDIITYEMNSRVPLFYCNWLFSWSNEPSPSEIHNSVFKTSQLRGKVIILTHKAIVLSDILIHSHIQ